MAQLITIGCKLPHGIIIEHKGKKAELRGANSSVVIGGYGITQVDKELFEAWSAANPEFVPFKRGLIFATEKTSAAESIAKERASVVTGLEGLNPNKLGSGLTKATDADGEAEVV